MRYSNETALPARLFRSEPKKDEMLAIAVIKATRPLTDQGLGPADPQGPEPAESSTETDRGVVPSDRVPYKRGTDVWVMGTVHARNGVPTPAMTARLAVAGEVRELLVVGDRRWDAQLHATPPIPFVEMPIGYAQAFGGKAPTPQGDVPYPANPAGRGFVYDRARAPGSALPNVEWLDQRISQWSDRPTPAGFGALSETSAMYLERAMDLDQMPSMEGPAFKPGIFNFAHPRLRFPDLAPRDRVELGGFHRKRVWSFQIPEDSYEAVIVLGKREHRLRMRLDTIGIDADERTVQLTYRASARYRFVAGQRRELTLVAAAA